MFFKKDWSAISGRASFFETDVEVTFFLVNVIYRMQNNMAEDKSSRAAKAASRSRLTAEDFLSLPRSHIKDWYAVALLVDALHCFFSLGIGIFHSGRNMALG